MIEFLPVIILVFSFLVLLIVGVPVAWCIAMSSLFTLMVAMPFSAATTTVSQRIATGLDSFALLAIPFFILSGQIMSKVGIANRLISFAKTMVGFLPGGLALINIVSAMLMGAIAGSAMASASAMGTILGPEMEKEGYSKEFGAAVNITSSTTGLVIPPSNTLIVYSLASGGVSIAALFLAGYIPGILTGLLMMIVAMVWAKKNKYPVGKRSSLKEVFVKFIDALPSLLLLVIVIGGIIGGVFTATEASAVAVLYTVLLSFYYKELSLKDLPKVILESSQTGNYAAAVRIHEAWLFVPLYICNSLFPSIMKGHAEKQNQRKKLIKLYGLLFTLTAIVALFILQFSNIIIELVYADKYAKSAQILQILSFSSIFFAINLITNRNDILHNQNYRILFRSIVGMLANILLNLYLIRAYGSNGAAIATIISLSIVSVVGILHSISVSEKHTSCP